MNLDKRCKNLVREPRGALPFYGKHELIFQIPFCDGILNTLPKERDDIVEAARNVAMGKPSRAHEWLQGLRSHAVTYYDVSSPLFLEAISACNSIEKRINELATYHTWPLEYDPLSELLNKHTPNIGVYVRTTDWLVYANEYVRRILETRLDRHTIQAVTRRCDVARCFSEERCGIVRTFIDPNPKIRDGMKYKGMIAITYGY